MIEIPARRGKAAHLQRGQTVKVVNTAGQQVVDTWAFAAGDLARVHVDGAQPRRHRPDHPGGRRHPRHQPAAADPDPDRGHLGRHSRHAVCRLRPLALRDARRPGITTIAPTILPRRRRRWPAPPNDLAAQSVHEHPGDRRQPGRGAAAGQHSGQPRWRCAPRSICLVAFSACPQDLLPINGGAMTPTHAHFWVRRLIGRISPRSERPKPAAQRLPLPRSP